MCKKIIMSLLALCCSMMLSGTAQMLSISSQSAVVIEADSGEVLFEKDAHTARPMASTTKLMTALVAAETLPLDKDITVSATAVAVEGSALGLRAGDSISLADLLTGLLLASGNDAANVTAQAVARDLPSFANKMNAKAAMLGMKDSRFVTPSGLDAEGHAASAYDMALLGRAVLQNDFLSKVCATKSTKILFGNPKREVWVSNHNRLLKMRADCIGMKTGFTKRAGKCLVSAAERDGVTVVAATLNGGDYWNDHIALHELAFSKLQRVTLPNVTLADVPVSGGVADTLQLSLPAIPQVTLNKEVAQDIQTTLLLPSFVVAPVAAGEKIGQVVYTLGERELARIPITAKTDIAAIPPLSFWEQLIENFTALLRWLVQ